MKNIDTAFRYVRWFTLAVVCGSFSVTLFALYQSGEMASESAKKIYVLADGKALEAMASDRKENIPVEARDHIKMFHHYFFTLDPDDKVIQGNITKALYLADQSAKRQYQDLKESGYYSNIIAGNISQTITIDSVGVQTDNYPFYFRCRATQKIIRSTSISYRNLVTEGYLRNVSRSDNNPHGFLIEKWRIIENNDIRTEAR